MTYRELLDLYIRNELDTDQKNQVEMDIEKQEAISDHLYEKNNIPALKEVFDEQRLTGEADLASTEQERRFMKMVKQSIRRAFMKMGIIASAIALIILLFIQIVLPDIVSCFYYDPGKEVAENTNQMSLDMAVYTELLIPQYFRYNVNVEALGYGNYEFCINQNVSYNGVMTNVPGRIEQGRMIMYEPNALRKPLGNAFAYFGMSYQNTNRSMRELTAADHCLSPAGTSSSECLSNLNDLSGDEKYIAYITLQEMMEYPPLIRFVQDNSITDAWFAVCTNWNTSSSDLYSPDNIGFQYTQITPDIEWDHERYPNLMLADYDLMSSDPDYYDEYNKNLADADFMHMHFISLLRYMSEQKKFLKMMNTDPNMFSEAADYVEENKMLIYGFTFTADKEQLLELAGQDEVFLIYTQPLR